MNKDEFERIVKEDAAKVADVMADNAAIFENTVDQTVKKTITTGVDMKDFIVSRLKNLFAACTSRKNALAVFAIFLFGLANPYVAGGLIAIAMILSTVEKCFHLQNENTEARLKIAEASKAEADSYKELAKKI